MVVWWVVCSAVNKLLSSPLPSYVVVSNIPRCSTRLPTYLFVSHTRLSGGWALTPYYEYLASFSRICLLLVIVVSLTLDTKPVGIACLRVGTPQRQRSHPAVPHHTYSYTLTSQRSAGPTRRFGCI